MRDLAKSLNSFSWAMSLFASQQALLLLRRPLTGSGPPAGVNLESVTKASERQLGGFLERTFQAGDQLQRSAVDLAFGVITLEVLDPNRLISLSANVLRQSTSALRSLLPGGQASGSSSCGQVCGWGPMPPAT
jgi:hypothetical protein